MLALNTQLLDIYLYIYALIFRDSSIRTPVIKYHNALHIRRLVIFRFMSNSKNIDKFRITKM